MSGEATVWPRQLAARWTLLKDRPPERGVSISELPIALAEGPVLAGVDLRGDRHLLVPVQQDSPVLEDVRSAHIQIRRRELVFDGVTSTFVDVVCHRLDLGALFDEVLTEILNRLETTPAEPDKTCVTVLEEWRELLRRHTGVMGDSELRGLFGELIVLERILTENGGHGLETWSGPDRTPHDFRLAAGDLEVKTLGPTSAEVEIHGIDQLEPPAGGELHLVLVRLAVTTTGDSLPELVDRVRSVCVDHSTLSSRLGAAGYEHTAADRYAERRFVVEQLLAIRVDVDFPRITRTSLIGELPEHITTLAYGLDLSGVLPSASTGRALGRLFERGSV